MLIVTKPLKREEIRTSYGTDIAYAVDGIRLTAPKFIEDKVLPPGVYDYSIGLTKSGKGLRINGRDDGTITVVGDKNFHSGVYEKRQDLLEACQKESRADNMLAGSIQAVKAPAIIQVGEDFAVVTSNAVKTVSGEQLKDYCEKNQVTYPFSFSRPLKVELQDGWKTPDDSKHEYHFKNALKSNSWKKCQDEFAQGLFPRSDKDLVAKEMTEAINGINSPELKENAYMFAANMASIMNEKPAYLDELKPFTGMNGICDIKSMYADIYVKRKEEIDFEAYTPSKTVIMDNMASRRLLPCFLPEELGGTAKYAHVLKNVIDDVKDNYIDESCFCKAKFMEECLKNGLLDESQLSQQVKTQLVKDDMQAISLFHDVDNILDNQYIMQLCEKLHNDEYQVQDAIYHDSDKKIFDKKGITYLDEAGVMPPEAYETIKERLGSISLTDLVNVPENLKTEALKQAFSAGRQLEDIKFQFTEKQKEAALDSLETEFLQSGKKFIPLMLQTEERINNILDNNGCVDVNYLNDHMLQTYSNETAGRLVIEGEGVFQQNSWTHNTHLSTKIKYNVNVKELTGEPLAKIISECVDYIDNPVALEQMPGLQEKETQEALIKIYGQEKTEEMFGQYMHKEQEQEKTVNAHQKEPEAAVHTKKPEKESFLKSTGSHDRADNSQGELFNPAFDMSKFGDLFLVNDDAIGIEEEMEEEQDQTLEQSDNELT